MHASPLLLIQTQTLKMGSCLSSTINSYHELSNRGILSHKTTTLPISQPSLPLSLHSPAEQPGLVNTRTNGSVTAPIGIQLVDAPTATSDESANSPVGTNLVDPPTATNEGAAAPLEVHWVDPLTDPNLPKDESKKIAELLQPASVATLSLILLVNAPKSVKPNLLFPYNAYVVLTFLSLFTSIALCMYSLVKSTLKKDFAWLQKSVMITATGSILISVMLRLVLVLSTTNMRYDSLSILTVGGGIILYIWYNWSKANDLSLTSESTEIGITANQV